MSFKKLWAVWKKKISAYQAGIPQGPKPGVEPLPVPAQPDAPIVRNIPPVVTPPPVVTGDALEISLAQTISKYVGNIPAMPVRGELRNVKLSADRVTFETSDEPWIFREWGRIAIIWRDGGKLIAGEFDARRPGQKMKGLENIHGGYIQNKKPRAGDPVWFVVYDMHGTQRSTVADGGTWK